MNRARRAISQDDLFRFRFLLQAQLSPDGESIVYALSNQGPDEDEEYAAIWILSLATDVHTQLTDGLAHDAHPQWAPDGERLAFRSNRASQVQIYAMSRAGSRNRRGYEAF